MFSLIWASMNSYVNNREAGDLRRQHAHYDVTVMCVLDVSKPLFENIVSPTQPTELDWIGFV